MMETRFDPVSYAIGKHAGGGGGGVSVEALSVTANGSYTAPSGKAYSPVTVDVPAAELQSKSVTITQNGTQTVEPDSGYDGLESVAVSVNVPGTTVQPLSVTQNGTYTPSAGTAYGPVSVNVEGGGGGAAEQKDVNFIDYDGTIRYSYTAAEFAALTAMPENPTHAGLTAQGWNWGLADAQAYVAEYGKLWIGQMYITDDGKTRIYIHLEEGRLAPYLGIAVNGTAVVDWGDGTAPDTVTGTSTSTVISTQHTYAKPGDYVIKIAVTGSMGISGSSSGSASRLLSNNSQSDRDRVYRYAIQHLEIGLNVPGIGSYGLAGCYSLKTVTIPDSCSVFGNTSFKDCFALKSFTVPTTARSIGSNMFEHCYGLESVAIPPGLTSLLYYAFNNCYALRGITLPGSIKASQNYLFSSCYCLGSAIMPDDGYGAIGNSMFQTCYSLKHITIPSSVNSIGTQAFHSCYGLASIRFKGATPPTVSNINAWSNIPTDCIIYVPAGSLEAYTTATNYPSSSAYNYAEY